MDAYNDLLKLCSRCPHITLSLKKSIENYIYQQFFNNCITFISAPLFYYNERKNNRQEKINLKRY